MTPMTRALLTNCTETLSLCLGLTPATERWDGRPSQVSQTRHPPHPHPRSVDFVSGATSCTDQRSALVADLLWVIPATQRSRGPTPVACRPADPSSRPVDLLVVSEFSTSRSIYFDRDSPQDDFGASTLGTYIALGSIPRPETDSAGEN